MPNPGQAFHKGGVAPHLSPRVREVVTLLADGLTLPEIAVRLTVTRNTVKTHVRVAQDMTDARTAAGIVATALRRGWIA